MTPAEASLKDMQAAYPEDVQPIAFRVAASVLLANVIIVLVSWPFGQVPHFISLVIDAALMIGLYQSRLGARNFTIFRAYAGAIVMPILAFMQDGLSDGSITAIVQLSYSGALILLLQGATRKWKIYTAITLAVFETSIVLLNLISLVKMAS